VCWTQGLPGGKDCSFERNWGALLGKRGGVGPHLGGENHTVRISSLWEEATAGGPVKKDLPYGLNRGGDGKKGLIHEASNGKEKV